MSRFAVIGRLHGDRWTIRWRDENGFNDPTGQTERLIPTREQVHQTATGPSFTPPTRRHTRLEELALVIAHAGACPGGDPAV